jgi:tRNA(His) 5'-end guanylyltransferase
MPTAGKEKGGTLRYVFDTFYCTYVKTIYSHRRVCIPRVALVSMCVNGKSKMRIVKRIEVKDPYDQ